VSDQHNREYAILEVSALLESWDHRGLALSILSGDEYMVAQCGDLIYGFPLLVQKNLFSDKTIFRNEN